MIYHCEQASVDVVNAMDLVPAIIRQLQGYEKHCTYKADEFGLQYRLSPNSTIASQQSRGIKNDNIRITFLACCNASGTDSLPLNIIASARCPRAFSRKSGKICVSITEVIQKPGWQRIYFLNGSNCSTQVWYENEKRRSYFLIIVQLIAHNSKWTTLICQIRRLYYFCQTQHPCYSHVMQE